jgi:DNA-binding response OmpR family regulator
MTLEMMGHDVTTVHGAAAAFAAIDQFAPEVVLLDIELPEMSGYEIAKRIRSAEEGTKIVLIAVTGRGQQEDKDKAREAGFDEHLTKPVDISSLANLLRAESAKTRSQVD